jgi:hypothetical protein
MPRLDYPFPSQTSCTLGPLHELHYALQLWNSAKSVPAFQHCTRLQRKSAPCWTNPGVMLAWGGNDQAALQAYAHGAALGDSMARTDAEHLKQALAAKRAAAANSSGFNPGAMFHAIHQQAVWAAQDSAGLPRTAAP